MDQDPELYAVGQAAEAEARNWNSEQGPEWMLNEKDLELPTGVTLNDFTKWIAKAQAHKIVEWLLEECNKGIEHHCNKTKRWECWYCMEQLRKKVGL